MTTDNPVAQPAGVEGAPERIWVEIYRKGYPVPTEFYANPIPHSVEYTRATPADLGERARRATNKFAMALHWMNEAQRDRLADIIAAEFSSTGNQST